MNSAAPLAGIRVLDLATLFAAPLAATMLGDLGADVIKVERPKGGDAARGHGPQHEGVGLWWKSLARNKRLMTLDLSAPDGQEIARALIRSADVLIENFRPGVMERWGLGPEQVLAECPQLIYCRLTAYGRSGPKKDQPGYGTLAEAMSGFAESNGDPSGPPTLPPFALADHIAGLATTTAILAALHARDVAGGGQVIDMNIVEPMVYLLGPSVQVYDQLGVQLSRQGNRSVHNAPRNLYRTKDDRWLALASTAQRSAENVMAMIDRPDLVDEPWFGSARGRSEHGDELDQLVADWVRARSAEDSVAAAATYDVPAVLVQTISDVVDDPQLEALSAFRRVEDADLGSILMQESFLRLQRTRPSIRWTGRKLGADTDEVLTELGYDAARRAELAARSVI
jgi:crotonobetainyl-CoA:carnitine CoA-transferase CaiB-like acyl-CoA transferase